MAKKTKRKAKSKKGTVSRPGGLLEEGGEGLTDDEQALLLALLSVDAEIGENLDEEKRAALDELRAQLEGYDPEELAQAAKHVVKAKSRKGRKLEWPELKRKHR
jgi:hypothetical protein